MLTPRYFFTKDFNGFYDYFLSQPHRKKTFEKGDYLWAPEEPFRSIHYIVSGLAQNFIEHENGRRKIISFHGPGTVFPGYHQHSFRIEQSIITRAVCDMQVLEFTKDAFRRMFETNSRLSAAVVEWFSMYTNLLLYDMAHQEYNHSFTKLCNLLYLLHAHGVQGGEPAVDLTQEDLSDILGISRVNLTRSLARLRDADIIRTRRRCVEVKNPEALARYCSMETVPELPS